MTIEPTPVVALRKAVEIAGSQNAVAKIAGVTQQAVAKWLRNGKPLPAEHVLPVEKATGIPKEELRPDIYPPQASAVNQ